MLYAMLPARARLPLCQLIFFGIILVTFQGCTGFDHLTTVDPVRGAVPASADCGGCHVDQYREWQGSAHNLSYTDPLYRDATDDYEEKSCLTCHVPASIRRDELEARTWSRHEGISCTSCHLDQKTMYGPHDGSALVYPHPIQADTAFYRSSSLCGVCHEETFATWKNSVKMQRPADRVPQCQQCHMQEVRRTSTRGTNIFSRMLVSFEQQHTVRSHRIDLAEMAGFPNAVQMTAERVDNDSLQVRVTNLLPHNLPGGEYTESSFSLVITPEKNNSSSPLSSSTLLSDSDQPFAPGESKQVVITADNFGSPLISGKYLLQLVRSKPGTSYDLQLAQSAVILDKATDSK